MRGISNKWLHSLALLSLLALVAYQSAQLIWNLNAPSHSRGDVVNLQKSIKTPWLSTVTFVASQDQSNSSGKSTTADVKISRSNSDDWILKGIYSESKDSVAIIQTPEKSYVVEVGESIGEGFIVNSITPETVTIANTDGELVQTLMLSNSLDISVVNDSAQSTLKSPIAYRPVSSKNSSSENAEWLRSLTFIPKIIDGKAALQISATSTEGFTQLRHFGLRQGDILLYVDGMEPSPEMWRVVQTKWRMKQPLVAQIKRFQEIKTITLENKK